MGLSKIALTALTTFAFTCIASKNLSAQSNPTAIAINSTTNTIYVANFTGNSVDVFNGSTDAFITKIPMPGNACGIAVNSVTNKIYVDVFGSVEVIDGNTNTATRIPGVQNYGSPGITVNPVTNLIYVSNYDNSDLFIIDGNTDTLATTITFPPNSFATYLAANSTTNTIYSTDNFFPQLKAINGATNTYTTSTPSVYPGSSLTVDEAANKVLISDSRTNNTNPNYLDIVDVNSSTVNHVALLPDNGSLGVAVNPSTHLVYIATSSGPMTTGHIQVVDETTNTVTASINVGGMLFSFDNLPPSNVSVNSATNRIYAANSYDNTVSVIDGATNTVIDTITVP